MATKTPKKKSTLQQLDELIEKTITLALLTKDNERVAVTVHEVGLDILTAWHRQPPTAEQKCLDCSDISAEQLDALTAKSQLRLNEEAGKLNDPLFGTFIKAQRESAKSTGVDPEKALIKAMTAAMLIRQEGLPLPAGAESPSDSPRTPEAASTPS